MKRRIRGLRVTRIRRPVRTIGMVNMNRFCRSGGCC